MDFYLVHRLDLIVPFKVSLFKVFELSLELLELPCDSFVLSGLILVVLFELEVSGIILISEVLQFQNQDSFLLPKLLSKVVVLFLLLFEDS